MQPKPDITKLVMPPIFAKTICIMRGGKKDLMAFHSKKLAEFMSIDLDGGKAFEISTVIEIYKDYLNEQQMSLNSYTTRRLKL